MNKNTNKKGRQSIRLPEYDYSQEGLYFVTLVVKGRKKIFGVVEGNEMKLNPLGKIIEEEWKNTPVIRENVSLKEYVVMPNHFHAILHIKKQIISNPQNEGKFVSPSHTLGAIIRGFKGTTTRKLKEHMCVSSIDNSRVWLRNYYEHIIRTEKSYKHISEYIKNNPSNWNKDRFS